MGYTVWDVANGKPANRTRYYRKSNADKACAALNKKDGNASRYYVKAL